MFRLTAQGDAAHQPRKGRHEGRGEVTGHVASAVRKEGEGKGREGGVEGRRKRESGERLASEGAQVSLASRPAPGDSLSC